MATRKLIIGVDFGGVLMIRNIGCKELEEPAINMHDSLKYLLELKKLGHKLVLNSFCSDKRRAVVVKLFLDKEYPGLFDEVAFVGNRTHKKYILAYHGCDVMIDDNMGILTDIQDSKMCQNLVWFTGNPNDATLIKEKIVPDRITVADSWTKIFDFVKDLSPCGVADKTINIDSYLHPV